MFRSSMCKITQYFAIMIIEPKNRPTKCKKWNTKNRRKKLAYPTVRGL